MATNKNQHFVPRCYLKPFTIDEANQAINLFNVDRRKFINVAPVKNQCSGNYFYGKNHLLEDAIQRVERTYASTLREIMMPGYRLTEDHRDVLRTFWLLQYLRTEAASRRAVEMIGAMDDFVGDDKLSFRLSIRDAVQIAMRTFSGSMHIVSDLKICLLKNKSRIPFITSDDPAVLTNRWYLENAKIGLRSFGLKSAGAILLLPLSPSIMCLGYDGDMYGIAHENGWASVGDSEVDSLNQHQFLNCCANVFVRSADHASLVHDSFIRVAHRRPLTRQNITYAILDRNVGNYARYKVVSRSEAGENEKGALIHNQVVHPRPLNWPRQLSIKPKGFAFTNGTSGGYVRRARIDYKSLQQFRKKVVNSP